MGQTHFFDQASSDLVLSGQSLVWVGEFGFLGFLFEVLQSELLV